MKKTFCALVFALCIVHTSFGKLPNIIILYADDMGYGDLAIENPKSKIPTPNLDQLAREGLIFTDGHSSSGICTPSRYSLLTGRYHWRDFHDIVHSMGPSVFKDGVLTMPEMLRKQGYTTACIGKWHLGWDWDAIRKQGNDPKSLEHDAFDWSKAIPDGPLAHGFDYYFGDSVINFPPYTWIQDDKVLKAPDMTLDPKEITAKTKEGSWEVRSGPAVSDWDFYQVLPTMAEHGVSYIESRKDSDKPFFLYFSFPSPHAPIIPNDEFDGKSEAGAYGDFVYQTDYICGQLMDALERVGLADNTLVVFTADNGPEHYAYIRNRDFSHWSSAPFRGLKRDIYEGGHHVPFIIRWPDVIEANRKTNALVSQIDLMATFAAITDYDLPHGAAVDSHNLLPLLEKSGRSSQVRKSHVHNTYKKRYALRHGDWVLIDGTNGYHTGVRADWEKLHDYEADDDQPVELYNLKEDIGQKSNLAKSEPQRVEEMQDLLQEIREKGYSAPRLIESE
ncbi:arylsulfatase [Rubellicoccus peritrichatus]|uniref:Arylsulfatase n=1 Tax=Rubellicoccus peritrichatus TaxID=3080537 RepID=A0AAQ3LD84_9BACT|nr:arylsulfatase [Puniceicoccus sp. CR14]WOO39889.1 arylsulfatase [Puniceicoccus sp. CR14]